jgi:hypothetical protein
MGDDRWEDRALAWLQDTVAPQENVARFEQLPRSTLVADGTIKWRALDGHGRAVAFAIGSAASDPQQTERAVRNLRAARAVLSNDSRAAIIEPRFTANVDGRSIAVYPYGRPIEQSGWRGLLARRRFGPSVLRWLRTITAETASAASPQEVDESFCAPLTAIVQDDALGTDVTAAARRALERLASGQWRPHCVLIHNDFWRGNILRAPRHAGGSFGFVVIDWAGSRVRGQGLYDLVRISRCFRLTANTCQREFDWHCQTLGCSPLDAAGHLLAALGTIGSNLGGFPYPRYRSLVAGCFDFLQRLVGSDPSPPLKTHT